MFMRGVLLCDCFFFRCIDGADDDLFWMYFTVSSADDYNDNDKEGDASLETPSVKTDATSNIDIDRVVSRHSDGGDTEGASTGNGRQVTVVTNDEMRNHRMALLEPVPFKR